MIYRTDETRQQLLTLTGSSGYGITEHQLARWHREGLLPRPKQQPLGKGHGTQTVYPAGTGKQLLRLCEIRAHERGLLHIAWRLWWEDHEVSLKPIRAFMSRIATSLDKQLRSLVDPATGSLSEAKWTELVEGSREARLDRPLSRSRRRVSRDRMPLLMSIMLEVMAGLYETHELGATEDDSDGRILAQAFGLDRGRGDRRLKERARSSKYSEDRLRPDKDLELMLVECSRMLRNRSFGETLTVATDKDLLESRDQARSAILSVQLISFLAEQMPGSEAFALRGMDEGFRQMEPPDQALMVLWWLAWRLWGPPGLKQKLDSYYEEVQRVLDQMRTLNPNLATAEE